MLREVRHAHIHAQVPRAALESKDSRQDLEQRGLARTVGSDERDLLASLEGQVQPVVDAVLAIALDDPREADDHASAARGLREAELDGLGASGRHGDALEALERLDAALDLACLAGLIAEAFDEALGLRHLALLRCSCALELSDPFIALLDEVGVVAHVLGQRSASELGHVVGDGIDEVPIVADQDQAAGVRPEESLQPVDARQVEVVGWLVEEQDVGVLEQELGQRHPHHPAAREGADVPLDVGIGEPEPSEDAPRLSLEAVAAQQRESVLQAPILAHQLCDFGVVARLGELRLDVTEPMADPAHRTSARHHLGQHAAAGGIRNVLAQVADDDVLAPNHRAGVRLLLARDDFEEGGLARAIGTDDRDAPPGGDPQRNVAEQVLGAEGLRSSRDGDQGHGPGMVPAVPVRGC